MHCFATKAALIQCPLSAISRRAVSAIAISGQTPPSQFGRVVQITKLMPSSSTNRVCTLWYSLRSCRGLKARLLVPPLSAAANGNAGRWHADSTMRWFQNTPCFLRGNCKITLSRHAAERHFFEYGRRQTGDASIRGWFQNTPFRQSPIDGVAICDAIGWGNDSLCHWTYTASIWRTNG